MPVCVRVCVYACACAGVCLLCVNKNTRTKCARTHLKVSFMHILFCVNMKVFNKRWKWSHGPFQKRFLYANEKAPGAIFVLSLPEWILL